MRHGSVALMVAVLIGLTATTVRAADKEPAEKGLAGFWEGPLKVGAVTLRLGLNIKAKPEGGFTGTMDSVDEGAKSIPIETITVKDAEVKMEWPKLKATFEGKFSIDGKELAGIFKQVGSEFPLTFKRLDKAPDYTRPQEPKKPYPYIEEEVAFENKKAEVKLAGTLTLPKGNGPFPAVFMVSGSGPQDRDEAIMGHKPFLVIADHLTRHGIAVLRCDDRGVGGSTGKLFESTSEDFANDALAAVEFLKGRKEINPKKIGLIGHSEGGLIAPIAAAKSGDVAFIVLLAGPGVIGEEILYRQAELIARAEKVEEKKIVQQGDLQKKLLAVLKKEKDDKAAKEQIDKVLDEVLKSLTEEEKKEAEKQAGALEGQMKMMLTPWFRYFLTFDPRPTLKQVKCPVLALTGEMDLQVDPKQNLPEMEKALKEGGNKDVTVKEMKGLNHLLQKCQTGSLAEYGKIEETFNPEALKEISDWILKRTTTP